MYAVTFYSPKTGAGAGARCDAVGLSCALPQSAATAWVRRRRLYFAIARPARDVRFAAGAAPAFRPQGHFRACPGDRRIRAVKQAPRPCAAMAALRARAGWLRSPQSRVRYPGDRRPRELS